MVNKLTYLIAILLLFILSACGGDSSSSNSLMDKNATTFSLSVSDAPVDELSEVVICFHQIELKSELEDIVFEVGEGEQMIAANTLCLDESEEPLANTFGLNIKLFTGRKAFTLLEGSSILPGDYTQLRLIMADGSYGVLAEGGGKVAIKVPSNELKLDGFTAPIGELALTIEFDLRKSMTNPVGLDHYFLKPRGVRLVDDSESATIFGNVDANVLCGLNDANIGGSVYLFEGDGLQLSDLMDNGASESLFSYASTVVTYDGEDYGYEIGFVAPDDYTIAFSCDSLDDPDIDDSFEFLQKQEITVATEDLDVNFPPDFEP